MAALLEACAAGDLTAAERAVEGGANVKLSLGRSGPPVWGRRRARTVARAASILDHGVGEGSGTHGQTPLHVAIMSCVSDPPKAVLMANMLIKANADVNARDRDSNTPLHLCAMFSDGIWPARLLIAHGGDVLRRNRRGQRPSDLVRTAGHSACEAGEEEFWTSQERRRLEEAGLPHVKSHSLFLPLGDRGHAKLWSLH
ncbi:Ankyrin repeat domain-containing protein 1 (Cardiac ankyrin repeat protein) [Durusdinium trenchii]|uniref:Ankyrin repeat domain-containing protein 1 (Cardiac ankyrin repeat protein) n=1 Tax=Durusdinium trenchii TaxID=1381693 RepID=A0ABP0RHP0_9DINO